VAAASLGKDAAAVLYLDDYKPVFFEITAKVRVQKPTAGWKANAYIVFDYFSPTDFKFAGIDISTNKIVVGHRNTSGWIVDSQTPWQLKADTFYSVLVAINGNTVTVSVDSRLAFTYTFATRVAGGSTRSRTRRSSRTSSIRCSSRSTGRRSPSTWTAARRSSTRSRRGSSTGSRLA
jgi:hypothetical protein